MACHASEVMTGVAVVAFDGDGILLADNMPVFGQHIGEGVPVVGVECTIRQVLHFVVEPSEGCSITRSRCLQARPPSTQATVRPVARSRALMIHFLFFLTG